MVRMVPSSKFIRYVNQYKKRDIGGLETGGSIIQAVTWMNKSILDRKMRLPGKHSEIAFVPYLLCRGDNPVLLIRFANPLVGGVC